MSTKTKLGLLCFVLLAQGCNDFRVFNPSLRGIEERYAFGSRDEMEAALTIGEVSVSSSDPLVVEVEMIDERRAELRAVGVGVATVYLHDELGTLSYEVEVAIPDPAMTRLNIVEIGLLSEVVPVTNIAAKNLLAGHDQQLALRYFDADGPLYGSGLAEFALPETSSPCETEDVAALDMVCANFEGSQEQAVSADVGSNSYIFIFDTVEESEIVDLLLIAEDEANLTDGDIVRVDAVGVTEAGDHVYGIRARFRAPEEASGVGYFSYEYASGAEALELEVRALSFEERLTFHGASTEVESVSSCAAAPWRTGGLSPLLALAFAAMVRGTRRRGWLTRLLRL